jgi:uncharacterized membrane protein
MAASGSIHIVPTPQRQYHSTLPAAAAVTGALLFLPLLQHRTSARLAAAAAGGILAYAGIALLRSGSRGRFTVQYLRQSILVDRVARDLTAMWRNSGVLDAVMQPFGTVLPDGPNRLRWTLDIPFQGILSGEAEKMEERPGQLVHWRTTSDSLLQVDEFFRVNPRGDLGRTEVTLEYRVDYSRLPAGALLQFAADFLHRAPEAFIHRMLNHFKSLAETGETVIAE